MKKILLLCITLLVFGLSACDLFAGPTTTATTTTTELTTTTEDVGEIVRTELLELALKFGRTPDYEDLEFEADYNLYGVGTAVIAEGKSMILYVKFDGEKTAMISIYLDESNSFKCYVWEIDLIYIDYDNEIYIEIWYLHEDELFVDDYSDEELERSEKSFVAMLQRFDIDDMEWLITELGYDLSAVYPVDPPDESA